MKMANRRWRRVRAHANAGALGKAVAALASYGNAKLVDHLLQQIKEKHPKRLHPIKRPSPKWIIE